MKTSIIIIAIAVLALAITGCETTVGKLADENLSPKERARRAAAAVYGNRKPYRYYWTDERDGMILYGQAIVMPDGTER